MNTFIMNTMQLLFLFLCLISAHLCVAELSEADEALFNALGEEDVDAASAALEAGANINAISPRGQQTPLMQSVLHGRTKMVKWALENGERNINAMIYICISVQNQCSLF